MRPIVGLSILRICTICWIPIWRFAGSALSLRTFNPIFVKVRGKRTKKQSASTKHLKVGDKLAFFVSFNGSDTLQRPAKRTDVELYGGPENPATFPILNPPFRKCHSINFWVSHSKQKQQKYIIHFHSYFSYQKIIHTSTVDQPNIYCTFPDVPTHLEFRGVSWVAMLRWATGTPGPIHWGTWHSARWPRWVKVEIPKKTGGFK